MKTIFLIIIAITALFFAVQISTGSQTDNLISSENCSCCDAKCVEMKCCASGCGPSAQGSESCCSENCMNETCKECCKDGNCMHSSNDTRTHQGDHDLNTDVNAKKGCCSDKTTDKSTDNTLHSKSNCCK